MPVTLADGPRIAQRPSATSRSQSNAPLRAALVGAGQIAKQHLGALRALKRVEVVGVCDCSPVMAESTADRFGVSQWYTDYREMLVSSSPDIVHIATPPTSHFALAREALETGCHVIIEKPITSTLQELDELMAAAARHKRWVIEDYNYLFNDSVRQIVAWKQSGELGAVRHVDVQLCLDILAPGSRFSDRDAPPPAMSTKAGAVSDFITHLAYLALAFVGPHHHVAAYFQDELGGRLSGFGPTEMQALVNCEAGTALLGFSATSRPDSFILRVRGSKMTVETNLFETGVVTWRSYGGPRALVPVRNMFQRSQQECVRAIRSLVRKLGGGPGPYEGLWRLLHMTYKAAMTGADPPIAAKQIIAVNLLTQDILRQTYESCEC